MARNENLHKAKTNKNDVFFTGDYDMEQELRFYWPHFKDKVILMNCNDILDEEGTGSAFWRYFRQRHDILGFKEIIATHYNPDGPSFGMRYDGANETRFELQGHGEFDDAECIELLKESDIVITNPPFSRFSHGFVDTLMKYEKKFLVIGPLMAITYKEFFPHLKNDQVWLGVNANKTMQFVMPEDYELKGRAYIDDSGNKIGFVPGITWYTNIDNRRRNEKLFLVETYTGNEQHYPKYDNYDAINVDKCREIPKDYYGVMGVPISFFCVYNPEQFEVIGGTANGLVPECFKLPWNRPYNNPFIQNKAMPQRVLIRRRDVHEQ